MGIGEIRISPDHHAAAKKYRPLSVAFSLDDDRRLLVGSLIMDGLGRTNHILHLFQQFWSEYIKTSDAQRPGDSCSLLVCCYTYHCVRYLVYVYQSERMHRHFRLSILVSPRLQCARR